MVNILLIYEKMSPSVRLCAYEQLKWLAENYYIQFTAVHTNKLTNRIINECNILILVRGSMWKEKKIVDYMKSLNKYVIYVLDDDILNVPSNSLMYKYYNQPIIKSRIITIMKKSDMLITPSMKIKEKYKLFFNKSEIIHEPCVNFSFVKQDEKKNKAIRIGFAASVDRSIDSAILLEKIIDMLFEKYGNRIEIEIMGAKPEFIKSKNIKYISYIECYNKYQYILSERKWDIGLAPLPKGGFYECKYCNKYIEYGRNAIVGIFSNVPSYKGVIRHGENGYLCDNDEVSWVNAISELVENESRLKYMKKNVMEDINCHFLIDVVSKNYYEILPKLKYNNEKKSRALLKAIWILDIFIRALEYIIRKLTVI